MTAPHPLPRDRATSVAVACGTACVVLLALTAALGGSAAVPGLGAHRPWPPWDLAAGPSSWLVSVLLVPAWTLGAASVTAGLAALRAGWRPRPRTVALAAGLAVAALVVVPPLGSADHLSYTAYGRIAAAGDDPYTQPPDTWRGGADPVASAVQPPWRSTPDVYGPVGTAAMALAAVTGRGDLRLTVWSWQVLCGAAFLLVGWCLDRAVRDDPAARARAAIVWTTNPVLLGQLVLGAHVDVLAAAAAAGGLLLGARRPLPAGALLGVAVGVKVPFGLAALALCWGLRDLPRAQAWRTAGLGAVGGLVVLVPAHLWSGPHTYDQLREAARMISLATPWRLVADVGDPTLGRDVLRALAGPLSYLLALALATLLYRSLRRAQAGAPAGTLGCLDRNRVTAFLVAACAGWVLTAPYALPWYDGLAWLPLALLPAAPRWLDALMLARLWVLALAYVPGRVVGMTRLVEDVTLGFRRYVAPWLTLAVLALVVRRVIRRPAARRPTMSR